MHAQMQTVKGTHTNSAQPRLEIKQQSKCDIELVMLIRITERPDRGSKESGCRVSKDTQCVYSDAEYHSGDD